MKLRIWAISVDNDGNEHLYPFYSEQQPDLDKDLLPLMEADGITMEPEQWQELKISAWSDEISLTVHDPIDVSELPFRQDDNFARLWWRAESLEEVGKWTAQIIGLGGSIDKIQKEDETEEDGDHFLFIFTVPIDVAIRDLGYDSIYLHEFTLNDLPSSDSWLDENPEAKASVERGLKQAAEGKTEYLGSFAEFVGVQSEVNAEVHYVWKQLFLSDESKPRLLTPHSNPRVYEQPFDYYFESPELAKRGLIDFNGDPGWILCRETLEPLNPPISEKEFAELEENYS